MTRHELHFEGQDHAGSSEYAIRPFCTCGWAGDWQHAYGQASYSEHDAGDLFVAAAEAAGIAADEHLHHARGARLLTQARTAGLFATDPQEF